MTSSGRRDGGDVACILLFERPKKIFDEALLVCSAGSRKCLITCLSAELIRNIGIPKLDMMYKNLVLFNELIKPNFCFDLSHRRSTTVSLETRNSFKYGVDRLVLISYISGF